MFTGLIEGVGRIARIDLVEAGARIDVETTLAGEMAAGDSLSVNGVCLTVTPDVEGRLRAHVGPETLRITTLGMLKVGQSVNLERSMRADSRFGGHFVQGHVDGTGVLESIRAEGDSKWLTIAFPPELAPLFVPKGSVAVDGISLTIAELRPAQFSVMIVPFTWQATALATLAPGDRVNLECDMIGKYVVRALEVGRD